MLLSVLCYDRGAGKSLPCILFRTLEDINKPGLRQVNISFCPVDTHCFAIEIKVHGYSHASVI